MAYVVYPILVRELPVEVDDSYVRIFHAVRMAECFDRNCPALKSIQTLDLQDPELSDRSKRFAWDLFVRATIEPYPLHSITLLGLHALGFSLEAGHDLLVMAGHFLYLVGFYYWLRQLCPASTTGIALALFSIMLMGGLPLLSTPHSNTVLGMAFLSWGAIIRWRQRSAPLLLFLLPIMGLWHAIGKMWALVTLVIWLWYAIADRPIRRRPLLWMTATTCVTVFSLLLPLFFPLLNYHQNFNIDNHIKPDLIGILSHNLHAVPLAVTEWTTFYRGNIISVILLGLGVWWFTPGRRLELLFWLTLFISVCMASMLDFHLNHPGHLFVRVFEVTTLVLNVIVASTLAAGIALIGRKGEPLIIFKRLLPSLQGKIVLLSGLVLFGLMGDQLLHNIYKGIRDYPNILRHFADRRQNYSFPPEQVEILLDPSHPCQDVAYNDISILFFHLSHGALSCGVSLPHDGDGSSSSRTISHVTAWNPGLGDRGVFLLNNHRSLEIRLEEKPVNGPSLAIQWRNSGQNTAMLRLSPQFQSPRLPAATQTIEHHLPGNSQGTWHPDPTLFQAGGDFLLSTAGPNPVDIAGIRFDDNSKNLHWPWDQGITLVHTDASRPSSPRLLHFRSADLWPKLKGRVTILHDGGSINLGRFDPSSTLDIL
ncbi:MAG: hypothetical protein HQL76_03540 [Magnetococcales bacterium]|nr:hypothetical protein [Magnetococcales bacterium]